MSERDRLNTQPLESQLQVLAETIQELAEARRGDSLALLALLRTLEKLHQTIRDGLFQESLPDNRQALYGLLRDIETTGGWPYIYRMRLQALLANLQPSEAIEGIPTLPNNHLLAKELPEEYKPNN